MLVIKTRVPQVATCERIDQESWGAIREGSGRQTDMALEYAGVCLQKSRKVTQERQQCGSRRDQCRPYGVRENESVQPRTTSISVRRLAFPFLTCVGSLVL